MNTVVERQVVATSPVAAGWSSAVSWGAILAGAFVIAALALILLALGAGFGLSTVSPWPHSGVSAATFTVVTAIWLIVVQWVSAATGGYLAGRLRSIGHRIHDDEAYFRDTAHGVFAWAVATVAGAALLAGAAGALTGGAAALASGQGGGGPTAYAVDAMFRSDNPAAATPAPGGTDPRPEAVRIVTHALAPGANGAVADADRTYLANLVAARTGLSQADAQKRVDTGIADARQAADAARKAAAQLALFIGFSMLIGGFVAGVAGRIGGHHRDDLAIL